MTAVLEHPTSSVASCGAPRELDVEGCRVLLQQVGWGILATVSGGQPYAVPVGYALGADCVFVASGSGQKLANLEANPAACLTVTDVHTYARWRSVVIPGAVTDVVGAPPAQQRSLHSRGSDHPAAPRVPTSSACCRPVSSGSRWRGCRARRAAPATSG